eukprot:XP_028344069.1 DNA-directed RNA polymerase I subunit RPA1-like [Physeter catodon]
MEYAVEPVGVARIKPSAATVVKHVLDGDVVLMNRQPSLHRLSLMGHFVRISRGACKWYHVNDYLFRNGVQQKLVEKHSERQPPRTKVYAGLSCYIDSRENTVVLDRGCGKGSRLLASSVSSRNSRGDSVVAFGDPYRRRLLAGNSIGEKAETGGGPKLVIVPPAVVWPQKLWTGKQVITCILKTLVDGIAAKRLAQVQNTVSKGSGSKGATDKRCRTSFSSGVYRGINLTGKAKTPGDAWGGAEDGDTEEERVIIQESELLQGVFDKAQFGSNAGGLLHCVFILLGSAAAGLLLQSLAALFCAFLKLR